MRPPSLWFLSSVLMFVSCMASVYAGNYVPASLALLSTLLSVGVGVSVLRARGQPVR